MLYGALPIVLYIYRLHLKRALIPALFLTGILVLVALLRDRRFPRSDLLRFREVRGDLPGILRRLALGAVALFILVLVLEPRVLLAFPKRYPGMWCLIMIFYPLVSV